MEHLYAQFTSEKQYLQNVSPATVEGYQWAWKAFESILAGQTSVTKADITSQVAELHGRGLSPVTINTYLRSLNTFFRWMHQEGHSDAPLPIPRLKEPEKVYEQFSAEHVRRLVRFSPRSASERRIHTLACLILDTGLRIDEALSIERADVDLDNLLLKVSHGKGSKERVVPFSLVLRKLLFRYLKQQKPQHGDLLFFAGAGVKMNQRNALRAFKRLCARLQIKGVRCSFHTLRHTFATAYLRNGGDAFRLQRVLGHTKLEMTRRYVNLQTEDLQAVHERCSALAKASNSK
jgi:integrase/recombinase XerD